VTPARPTQSRSHVVDRLRTDSSNRPPGGISRGVRTQKPSRFKRSVIELRSEIVFYLNVQLSKFDSDPNTVDDLARLREEARIAGGTLKVPSEVSEAVHKHLHLLPRFGLEFNEQSENLRLHINKDLARALPGFLPATSFDPSPRVPEETSLPDPVLLRHSSFTAYRSRAQKSVVRAIATMPAGGAALVNMPTGGGKSLVFQLLARLLRHVGNASTIVVIVPTIALGLDHQRSLQAVAGLERSRVLHSGATTVERETILGEFWRGELPILLVSPETFINRFEDFARAANPNDPAKLYAPGQLDAVVVDEAHIVEQWGRQFRPDFQRLSAYVERLRRLNPALRTVLLSATIDTKTRTLLTTQFSKGAWLEIDASRPRYEFDLLAKSFDNEEERDQVLDLVIDHAPRPAIIYTTEVTKAEALHARLRERGYRRLGLFTGRTAAEERHRVIQQWSADAIDLIVATSAFGMGVDKANVRAVIHACLPESVSRFYQEIGRAGRDGRQALSVLLWTTGQDDGSDLTVARGVGQTRLLTVDLARKRWKALLGKASATDDDVETGRRCLIVDLAAAHSGLDDGNTDKNRNWNAGLLTFLQRIGYISVLSATDLNDRGRHLWTIRIDEPHLVSSDAVQAERLWTYYDTARCAELEASRLELKSFVKLLERQYECTLIGAFEAIEPASDPFPPCGRCAFCREKGIEPPVPPAREARLSARAHKPSAQMLNSRGLQIIFAKAGELIERLPDIAVRFIGDGFRHFVVDSQQGPRLASFLLAFDEPTFVSTWDENLGFSQQMPTVFLAPDLPSPAVWWPRVDEARQQRPQWPFVLVMPQGQLLHGKKAFAASLLPPTSLDDILAGHGER
jgi:ATP-dependent DNA helicase RecQ